MQREELFSRFGFYRFVMESNALLHREAAAALRAALRPLVSRAPGDEPLAVLDLACGGWPETVAETMASFPDQTFHYTGIDINPDQVASAGETFAFPANVPVVRIIEGNAWDLPPLGLSGSYMLVFSGMNLHHGTPDEISFLAHQLRPLLQPGGLFFSHDVYRPDNRAYRRRPEVNPDDPQESMALVHPQRLLEANLGAPRVREDRDAVDPAWRLDYIERMRRLLIECGAEHFGVESTAQHMRQRDFPVSVTEFGSIFERFGYQVRTRRYDESDGPLGPYVADCYATLPAGKPVLAVNESR